MKDDVVSNMLPPIHIIKDCIKNLAMLGDRLGKFLSETNQPLSNEIFNYSFTMFTVNKMKANSFTILGDKELRKMRFEDDLDGFSDEDSLFLSSYLKDNLEAFIYLVSCSYLTKPLKKYKTDNSIFFIEVYSKYSGKKHELFIVKKSDAFFIFTDRKKNKKLIDYVNDYFGNVDKIRSKITELSYDKEMSFIDMQRSLTVLFNDFSEQTKKSYDFINGSIMFLDFLGWKGLWLSEKSKDTLVKISNLIVEFEQTLGQYSREVFPKESEIPLSRLISISDTIAIFSPKISDVSENKLLELHAKLAKYILEKSINEGYPIRGAIAFGEYNIVNNIMIGPGIDECASWHEKCDWIGVHLTPSAQFIWSEKESDYIIKQNISLKTGLPRLDFCVKWDVTKDCFLKLVNKTKAMLPEISGKYINTYKFLEVINWSKGKLQ